MTLRQCLLSIACATAIGQAQAATVFSEGFDNVAGLAGAGWIQTNSSDSPLQPWFQGNTGIFSSFAGAANSYVAANFESSSLDAGKISNWLIMPSLALASGSTLSFYARTDSASFADALTVRLSPTGSSATADFTTTLLTLASLGTDWTLYSVALPVAAGARIAFQYNVPSALDADYIGIDSVAISTVAAIPEPESVVLLGLGLTALMICRRRMAAGG